MKAERKEPDFNPIVITLETEIEARALKTVLDEVFGVQKEIFDPCNELRAYLQSMGVKSYVRNNMGCGADGVDADDFNVGR